MKQLIVRPMFLCAWGAAVWVMTCVPARGGLVGTPHVGESFGDLVLSHDVSLGGLRGVDFSIQIDGVNKIGSATASPGDPFTKIGLDGLPAYSVSVPGDFGIGDFKTALKYERVGQTRTWSNKLRLGQTSIGEQTSISAGGGVYKRYIVTDPTLPEDDPISLRLMIAPSGTISIPSTRTNVMFSFGFNSTIDDADTDESYSFDFGQWGGSYNTHTPVGLFAQSEIDTGFTQDNDTRTFEISGAYTWDVVVPNGATLDLEYTGFYGFFELGDAGGAGDVAYDFGDTLAFSFGPTPGNDNVQLILVPEPGVLAVGAVSLALLALGRRRRVA